MLQQTGDTEPRETRQKIKKKDAAIPVEKSNMQSQKKAVCTRLARCQRTLGGQRSWGKRGVNNVQQNTSVKVNRRAVYRVHDRSRMKATGCRQLGGSFTQAD